MATTRVVRGRYKSLQARWDINLCIFLLFIQYVRMSVHEYLILLMTILRIRILMCEFLLNQFPRKPSSEVVQKQKCIFNFEIDEEY